MNSTNNLIETVLDDTITFKKLAQVARIRNGRDHKSLGDGPVPVYGTGGIMTSVDTAAYTKPSVLIPRKGSLNKLYYVDKPFWTVDTIFYTEIADCILPKFLYYYLLSQRLERLNQAGGVPSLTQAVLNELKIPVPPLEIQREIVRILDTFSALEAELEAELEARKRQYDCYFARVFAACNDAPTRKLAEVSAVYDSLHKTPPYVATGFSMIRVTDIKGGYVDETQTLKVDPETFLEFTRKYVPKLNDIAISRVGSYGNFAIIASECQTCMGQNTAIINPFINPKYLYYALQTEIARLFIEGAVGGGSQKTLSLANIREIPIIVPPLSVQAKVVDALDKFEALVTDLNSGLPAELEARRKQYEYFRERLLTFKEA